MKLFSFFWRDWFTLSSSSPSAFESRCAHCSVSKCLLTASDRYVSLRLKLIICMHAYVNNLYTSNVLCAIVEVYPCTASSFFMKLNALLLCSLSDLCYKKAIKYVLPRGFYIYLCDNSNAAASIEPYSIFTLSWFGKRVAVI